MLQWRTTQSRNTETRGRVKDESLLSNSWIKHQQHLVFSETVDHTETVSPRENKTHQTQSRPQVWSSPSVLSNTEHLVQAGGPAAQHNRHTATVDVLQKYKNKNSFP